MEQVTHFVYPYIIPKDPVFGWELLYSIRSIYRYFKGPFDITIIGEIPSWANTTEILSIEYHNNDYGLRVQSKTNQKILLAAELFSDIVLMHDDYYLIQNCVREDFTTIRHLPETLKYHKDSEAGLTRFQKQIRSTYFDLKEIGAPYQKNFCTHAPFYYESNKLKELSSLFCMTSTGEYSVVTENAYYNYFGVDSIPLGEFRQGFWGDKPKKFNPDWNTKILNHDERGYLSNPWILTLLREKLSRKCRGEL